MGSIFVGRDYSVESENGDMDEIAISGFFGVNDAVSQDEAASGSFWAGGFEVGGNRINLNSMTVEITEVF